VHAVIKSKGTIVSEKVVRRIMEEEQLVVPNDFRGQSPKITFSNFVVGINSLA